MRDLALIGRSNGDSFNFQWQHRLSNGRLADPGLSNPTWVDAAIDPLQHVHILWIEQTISEKTLYYTRLDLAGNTLVEDMRVSSDGYQARLAADSSGSANIVYRRPYSTTGIF